MIFMSSDLLHFKDWESILTDAFRDILRSNALDEFVKVLPFQQEAKQLQWNLEALHAVQLKKLQELVRHAVIHSLHYQRVAKRHDFFPEMIKKVNDLQQFPSLRKDDLSRFQTDIVVKQVMKSRGLKARISRSSGASGKPQTMVFHLEDEFTSNGAVQARYWEAWGVKAGEIINCIRRVPNPSFVAYHAGWYLYHYTAFSDVVNNPEILNNHPAMTILGDPFQLKTIARAAQERGVRVPHHTVVSSYQLLDHSTRDCIAEIFGSKIFEVLSMTETTCPIAWECPTHSGLHVNSDFILVEILDVNSDTVLPPGELGELTITDLHNHLMPLIRYRTGDLAASIPGQCSCGRVLPLITSPAGRVGEVLEINGRRITTRRLFQETAPWGLGDLVIHVSAGEQITVKYSRAVSTVPRMNTILKQKLEKLFGQPVQMQLVPNVHPTRSGKFSTLLKD